MHPRRSITEAEARRLANVAGTALDALFRPIAKQPDWLTDERLVAIIEARSYVRRLRQTFAHKHHA